MADIATIRGEREWDGSSTYRRMPVFALGCSLAIFAMLTYSLCVALMFVIPDQVLHRAWLQFLPYFSGLNWSSYLIGLAEVFVYSWYIALVFAPIYNAFAARRTS